MLYNNLIKRKRHPSFLSNFFLKPISQYLETNRKLHWWILNPEYNTVHLAQCIIIAISYIGVLKVGAEWKLNVQKACSFLNSTYLHLFDK